MVESSNDQIAPPRAQKYAKFLGQQIKIEINQQHVPAEEMCGSQCNTTTFEILPHLLSFNIQTSTSTFENQIPTGIKVTPRTYCFMTGTGMQGRT